MLMRAGFKLMPHYAYLGRLPEGGLRVAWQKR